MRSLMAFPSPLWRAVRIHAGVYSAAIPLVIAGIGGLVVAIPWSTAWSVSLSSIAVGCGLLIWGIRIHDLHVWQSWWRGMRLPLFVHGGVMPLAYAPGSIVGGIRWQRGFSHLTLQMTNTSRHTLSDLTVLFRPEYPIVDTRARCDLTNCYVGPRHGHPKVTIVTRLPDGEEVAMPATRREEERSYTIDPVHRLYCDDVPSKARIDIDLATVVPSADFPTGRLWKQERRDPQWITLQISWVRGETIHEIEGVIDLAQTP